MNKTYTELRALLDADAVNPRSVAFEVNTTPELHRRLNEIAQADGCTIDELMNDAIRRVITREHARHNIRDWLNDLESTNITLSAEDMAWLNDPTRLIEAGNGN